MKNNEIVRVTIDIPFGQEVTIRPFTVEKACKLSYPDFPEGCNRIDPNDPLNPTNPDIDPTIAGTSGATGSSGPNGGDIDGGIDF